MISVSRLLASAMVDTKCRLLGGTFSTFVQASLGIICISALVIKRQNEVPQRDWYVWYLDVMKQAIGSGFGHFANIFLSVFISGSIEGADECQWYCVTYITDATVGTAINILLLKCFESQVERVPDCTTMKFGEYGNPPRLSVWFPQLFVWLFIVILAKMITLLLLFQFLSPLNDIASYVFKVFEHSPELELVVVMIIIPTILNTVQFWVTDTFLKLNVSEELEDSELDEELIAGGHSPPLDGNEDEYLYRSAAPMRSSSGKSGVLHRTHSGNSGSKDSNAAGGSAARSSGVEGIQLSSLGFGTSSTGTAAVAEYSSLPTSSSHGYESRSSNYHRVGYNASSGDMDEGEIDTEIAAGGDSINSFLNSNIEQRQGTPRSPTRQNSSIFPASIFTGLSSLLPNSITGMGAVKLARVGSDESVHSRSTARNPVLDVGKNVNPSSGMIASHGNSSTVKLRSTTVSVGGTNSGSSGGAGSGLGRVRATQSVSVDSTEEDSYL